MRSYSAACERFLSEHKRCASIMVASHSTPGVRYVVRDGRCSCPGFVHRGRGRHVREGAVTLAGARERMRQVAREVSKASEPEAVARFLERVAAQPDAEELRAALVLVGAEAVVRGARS